VAREAVVSQQNRTYLRRCVVHEVDREIIKAYVRANITPSQAEAEHRVRTVRLTVEELIFAWYRADLEYQGRVLKKALMDRILESQTFDEWTIVAVSINLPPYRPWAVEHLMMFEFVTDTGIARLAKCSSHGIRKLAKELNERPRLSAK
jgi:hypothetical protein